tara:strand:+ start:372 stop:473 length:102 start_codon:yes stop_codon:yes gene_type:complete
MTVNKTMATKQTAPAVKDDKDTDEDVPMDYYGY